MGGVFVMLVLYLFLKDFWVMIIIFVFILVLVIVIFNLMYVNNISLNMMSLGGIVFVVGLFVDNSIVVFENIDCYKKLKVLVSDEVVVGEGVVLVVSDFVVSKGIKEVFGVIIVFIFIIMVVFVLFIFVEGIVG